MLITNSQRCLQIPFFCLSNIQTQRLIVNDISVYMLPGVTYS